MYLTNLKHALINNTISQISVYETTVKSAKHTGGLTAGGTRVGIIFPGEMYTLIPNFSQSITSYQIFFRDGNGNQRYGYIETSPGIAMGAYIWVQGQEPYHMLNSDGKNLFESRTMNLNKMDYHLFTVKKSVNFKSLKGDTIGYLPSGTQLATRESTCGQQYNGYMYFRYRKVGNLWLSLVGDDGGFVELGYSKGSMPNDRCIW